VRLAAILLLLPLVAISDERILSFDSNIVVRQDGALEVTETISVRAEGARIERGIYRDFPTTYRDQYGNRHTVHYEPLAVLRDGSPENFFSEGQRNGVRTYFGSSNVYLEPGIYTYVYRYRASRMLGFFDEFDELYWNVTGHDWAFPIDRASATITLDFDGGPQILGFDAWTGPIGSVSQDFTGSIPEAGKVQFSSTRELGRSEGLTVVANWPKGFVAEPGQLQELAWILSDNLNLGVALLGLSAMLVYLIPVWRSFGKDPEEGLLVTRYQPPDGFSPASLRYIQQMYYDNKVMTSAVVNLAVKGYLRINKSGDLHTLDQLAAGSGAPPMATGEKELYEALFRDGSTVILDDKYHELLGRARKAHRWSLKRDYAGRYFKTNGILSFPALFIGILASIVALNVGSGPTPLLFVVIALMVVVYATFAAIMKRPTGLGRKLLDQVLGFRDYLEIAEKDELNLRNPPDKTPQLFEAILPFALALNVEQAWAEKFASVFARMRGSDGREYNPSWYNGSWNSLDMGSNTAGLTSGLNNAISSSVTPPGSSSGSGGGGFSGGGGGGGGGGGW